MTTQNPLSSPDYPLPDAETPSPSATPTPGPQTDQPWQSMYNAERKRARVLGATTVAVSLLAVGLGAWGINAQGATASGGPGQFGPPGMSGNSSQGGPGTGQRQGTIPGQGSNGTMPGPVDLGSLLLNSDGSVNTDAVEQFVQRIPSGALDQILAMAVSNGELTQDQADQIAAGSTGTQDT